MEEEVGETVASMSSA